jgi:5S rRNA maturation endonuclease (ribonuclease M5)
MDYSRSLEEVQKTLSELIEENRLKPVIVEGEKDVDALRRLGLAGKIVTLNSGVTLIDFCDRIAEKYEEVIILTDWDRKGGFLYRTIERNLEGRVKIISYYREVFSKNTMIRTVEGLPSWLDTMNGKHRVMKNQ